MNIHIERNFEDASVLELLEAHRAHCESDDTPPESRHRLNVNGLKLPDLIVWVMREGDDALGIIALKMINARHGEVKSMHVLSRCRGQNIAQQLLENLITVARDKGLERLSLETGRTSIFSAAIAFYQKHGFERCSHFEGYQADPNSVFMTLTL